MTTALEIITDAYRESNIIPIAQSPTTAQQTEALRRLNAVISSALGYEIGEGLNDWMVGNTNVSQVEYQQPNPILWSRPPANVRLQLNAQSTQTIYLPRDISDGARFQAVDMLGTLATYPVTLDGNGLRIENQASIVLNTDNLNRTWFYRADLGTWVVVASLEIGDDMPFPTEFDDAFVTLLAMRLNPRYGRAMQGESAVWLERSLNGLRGRYRQQMTTPADLGVLAMTRTGFGRNYGGPPYPRGGWGWMG